MFRSSKIAAAFAAAAALIAAASAASAEDFQSNGRTSEVYHGDLNLAKADQQKELRSRIARAASRVCASTDLKSMMACRSKAIAHVQAPVTAAIARAETGERYAAMNKDVRPVVGN
ncbi:UrcA family protein [Sphingobium sp. BYY-5]|uniref:UrcA family protein n=1 Tax=Sphingobium sp. BYY-5 TaxID=2926400 RepID=UPI001FA6E1F6|nr:UrcA family protein [Sphingobium sp. BYY-5]MCI4588741.1 UrcA family protein [Sphingobium sp. BYY-5]